MAYTLYCDKNFAKFNFAKHGATLQEVVGGPIEAQCAAPCKNIHGKNFCKQRPQVKLAKFFSWRKSPRIWYAVMEGLVSMIGC